MSIPHEKIAAAAQRLGSMIENEITTDMGTRPAYVVILFDPGPYGASVTATNIQPDDAASVVRDWLARESKAKAGPT